MFCSIIKMLISGAMDSGGELPPSARKHISRCPGCREFAELSAEAARRLSVDAKDTVPSLLFEAVPERKRVLRPALAMAAVVCFAVAAAWFLVTRPGKPVDMPAVPEISVAKLQSVLPEEPFSSELDALVQNTRSAAEYLQSLAYYDHVASLSR